MRFFYVTTDNSFPPNKHLFIVAVSDWLKGEAGESVLGTQSIIRIYNGIDTEIFRPHDKTRARQELGLPLDKRIVAFDIKEWSHQRRSALMRLAGKEH